MRKMYIKDKIWFFVLSRLIPRRLIPWRILMELEERARYGYSSMDYFYAWRKYVHHTHNDKGRLYRMNVYQRRALYYVDMDMRRARERAISHNANREDIDTGWY